MLELTLIRHGETDSGKQSRYCGYTDIELNEKGLNQAKVLSQRLKGQRFNAVYCSPLKRTAQTAGIINEGLNANIIFSEALKERNFGIWDNLTWQEILNSYPEEYECWCSNWKEFTISRGESAVDAHKRAVGFIDQLMKTNKCGSFLIVTHQGIIRSLLVYLLHMQLEDVWRFKIGNAGISCIEINDEGFAYLTKLNT